MKRFLLYTGFLLVLLYFSILYANPAFLTIFLILSLYPFAAWVFLFYQKKQIVFISEPKEYTGNQDQKLHLPYRLKNKSFFAGMRIRIYFIQRNSLGEKESEISYPLWLPPQKVTPVSLEVTASHCGRTDIIFSHILIYDWFFLFRCILKTDSSSALFIYPHIHSTQVQISEATSYFYAESEDTQDILQGHPYTPMPQIREYRNGDRFHQIHWKLSARMDQLLVKELGQPDGCPVLLFADLCWQPRDFCAASYSRLIEAVFSLSFHLAEQHCRHYVVWYDKKIRDLVRMQILQEEDLFVWIYTLFHTTHYEKKIDLPLLYRQKYPSDTYHTTFEVHPGPVIEQNGNVLLSFKEEDPSWQDSFQAYHFLV